MSGDGLSGPGDWMVPGEQDRQTVDADWLPVDQPNIEGVAVKEIRPVAASSGYLTEIWRSEWGLDRLPVDQVFQRTLEPGGITGWHAHAVTTDRLFCSVGAVRVSLYDGRKSSASFGNLFHRIIGDKRPALIIVPPGVWHGVKVLGSSTALLLNLVDRAYGYESPDHWRLPPDTEHIPYKSI
jgi:dTDP-4-dehydrorhamnose 3,5-epimerase